jgi:hypothetical protein
MRTFLAGPIGLRRHRFTPFLAPQRAQRDLFEERRRITASYVPHACNHALPEFGSSDNRSLTPRAKSVKLTFTIENNP